MAKQKIYVGPHIDRWNAVKTELILKTHHEVAGILLDRPYDFEYKFNEINQNLYDTDKTRDQQPGGIIPTAIPELVTSVPKVFSTPLSKEFRAIEPMVSEILFAAGSDISQKASSSDVSGVVELEGKFKDAQPSTSLATGAGKRVSAKKILSTSFIDPCNLSIDVTTEFDETMLRMTQHFI